MRIIGKVISIDCRYKAGLIRDRHGNKYTFRVERCTPAKMPKVSSYVSFEVDRELEDFIDMATDVRPEKSGGFSKVNWIISHPVGRITSPPR